MRTRFVPWVLHSCASGVYDERMTHAKTSPVGGSPTREVVAEEIRVLMARQRMSGRGLARAAGLNEATVSRRLNAEYPFDVDELERIAAIFGVPITALFGSSGPRKLPRLDSNQQPSDNPHPQANGLAVVIDFPLHRVRKSTSAGGDARIVSITRQTRESA